MSLRTVFDSFPIVVDAPNHVVKLRELLLQLGVRGELTGRWRTMRNLQREASWKTVCFFDFCVLQRGYDLPLAKCDDGRFPIVTSAGIAAYHSEYKATGPGVVVGRSGSIGKVFYVEENFWPHNTALYVRDFKGNYPRYVYYYLLSFNAAQFSKSTAVPTLNRNNLRGIKVDVPSFDEQQQIVLRIEELMGLCDELEAHKEAKRESRVRLNAAVLAPLNKAASLTSEEFEQATTRLADNFDMLYDSIDTVSKLRATILQLAVQGKLVAQDRRDEPAASLVKRIGQQRQKLLTPSELKKVEPQRSSDGMVIPFRVPEGWKWTRLGELSAKLGAGSTPLGGKNVYQDEGVKFLRSQNVWNDGLELNNVAYISETIHKEMSGTHVQHGDILLNITGASIGRSCVVPEHLGHANVSQHVSIIRLVDERLRFFIHLCIISPYVQDSIMQCQVGISREGLSMRNLKEFLMPIPPLDEQNRIVAKISQLMSLCDELEAKLRQAEVDSEKLMNAAVKHVLDSVRSASQTAEEVFA